MVTMLTRILAIIFGVAAFAVLSAVVSQSLNGEIIEARLTTPAATPSPGDTKPILGSAKQEIQGELNSRAHRYMQRSAVFEKRRAEIRNVDFANLTYPAGPIYSTRNFKLTDGGYDGRPNPNEKAPWGDPSPVGLVAIAYGDITGDGNEDAMVVLNESTRGTAIPYYLYVYTMKRKHPRLLWAVATGDRAEGGLRKAYAENGELVIELYGKGARVNGTVFVHNDAGACCPLSFTRTRYQWSGSHFAQHGTSEVFRSGDGGASLEMAPQGRS